MFVPLFLTGGSLGVAFAQSVVHSSSLDLYAAVGMASFISAGYKTPLAAVVFVAEATGGHAFIIPALIGAAVAYAISGDASASGDQRLHEAVRVQELKNITIAQVMQQQVISVQASLTLREFTTMLTPHYRHTTFPVFEGRELLGTVSVWSAAKIPPQKWDATSVQDIVDRHITKVSSDCDVIEALRLLLGEYKQHMLLVISLEGNLEGIVTKTDILKALETRRSSRTTMVYDEASTHYGLGHS
jgi:CIC family chloride channel protein